VPKQITLQQQQQQQQHSLFSQASWGRLEMKQQQQITLQMEWKYTKQGGQNILIVNIGLSYRLTGI